MLETDNYEKFKKDILQLAGIDLNSYKEKQMRRRINTLITKNNVKTYNDYVALIKKDKEKFDQFINFLTINVSEFYRNPDQWKILEGQVFPELIKKFGKNLKIWSADEDGTVYIYYASSDTRMHVAVSTIDKLVDYCMNTPADGLTTTASVETLKKLIDRNLPLLK